VKGNRNHIVKTPENEKLIYDIANDPDCYLGPDNHGKHCYAKMLEDGKQIWAECRNGYIRNGGINEPGKIRTYNSETGLAALKAPIGQKIPKLSGGS